MQVLFEVLLCLFYVLSPFGILYLCHKYTFVNKIGAVLMAYVVGVLLSFTGVLQGEGVEQIQEIIMSLCIPLGIPLLLFSSDFKKSLLLARNTLLSLLAAIVGVVIIVVAGYVLFGSEGVDDFYKISGLLIGVYTGGTPNLAALKMVLDVDAETYLTVHTYDMLFSTLHLFFLMTLGQKVFSWVLPTFKRNGANDVEITDIQNDELFWGLLKKESRIPLVKALGVAILIVAVGGGLMMLASVNAQMAVFILSITTLGILASFSPKIKSIPKTFDLGMYFILIFSVVVASKLNLAQFVQIDVSIFYYVLFVVFGSLFLHVVLSVFFKIDADTVIITSTAFICSPPFVPVVAATLKNKEIIIPGITVGVIGYAIGNYLGFLISQILIYI